MAMSFGNVLRGRIAERILVTLLERGGYRVTRLGIEELFDEVKYLPLPQYLALGLPPSLRTMPDLLVADPEVSWAKLIEVKFRRAFDQEVAEELHTKLTEQRLYWPDSYAVILLGESFVADGRFHQDFVRVVPPRQTDLLLQSLPGSECLSDRVRLEQRWNCLHMLTSIFPRPRMEASTEEKARSGEFWSAADYIVRALRELGKV